MERKNKGKGEEEGIIKEVKLSKYGLKEEIQERKQHVT